MTIATMIVRSGIGPSSDVAHIMTHGLDIGPAAVSSFDGGGIPLTRGQLKRLKRKAEDERRRREAGWDAGLLASKELIEQITRAFDGPAANPTARTIAPDDDDEDEIAMLLMVM